MNPTSLDRLARRASLHPHFLGHSLARYAAVRDLDEPALALALGVCPETLADLRLCPRPGIDAARLGDDLARLVSRFGVRADVLLAAVRLGETVRLNESAPTGTAAGFLLAARDREEPESLP